ncbi:transcriptional regulator [Paenibacillus sp. PK3_47]|uniref:helix-turn-helix transcriptional regulator n=1 Tax=Paenibacillus sp. PK3_47 TaxID=2072642 RepID=UPI00201DF067|nr:YafY family protein [Paenibacillus sp. PK3_47]UQZ32439.1 transcriptional regulator [Paenibacillus sp. PK3_47]
MRADRLLSILMLLQNRGKMTTRELAENLEVSGRTIVRDMEALSASGIPVLAERGREGGWMLTEGYRTSLTGMKPKELASLLLPADSAVLQALGIEQDHTSAVRKLEAAVSRSQPSPLHYLNQRVHIDGAGWRSSAEAYPFLPLLQTAVWEERKVLITYLRGDETTERLISPLGLVAKRGVWYAAAESSGELRTYRVSRITGAVLSEEIFKRPEGFDLARYWEESMNTFKAALPRYPAQLLLQEQSLKQLQQERYVTITKKAPADSAGWFLVDAEFNTAGSACSIILSLGAGAIVTTPQELHDAVKSALKETLLLYEAQTVRNSS